MRTSDANKKKEKEKEQVCWLGIYSQNDCITVNGVNVDQDNKMPNNGFVAPPAEIKEYPRKGLVTSFSRYGTLNNLIKDTNHLY